MERYSIAIARSNVCPMSDEHFDNSLMAMLGCVHQCSTTDGVQAWVCAVGKQRFARAFLTLRGSQHQWSPTVVIRASIDRCAVSE